MTEMVINLRALLREKQRERDDLEWEGLAPEKLQALLLEIEELEYLDSVGEVWYPPFLIH